MSRQIKNSRKNTGFKIQFYIGSHLSGIVLRCFSDLLAMSPSPNTYSWEKVVNSSLTSIIIISIIIIIFWAGGLHQQRDTNTKTNTKTNTITYPNTKTNTKTWSNKEKYPGSLHQQRETRRRRRRSRHHRLPSPWEVERWTLTDEDKYKDKKTGASPKKLKYGKPMLRRMHIDVEGHRYN